MSVPELTDPMPMLTKSAGQILASKRAEWELSVAEVAGHLNLSPDTIEAIEADEYSKLPGTTFIKGYIRSYAKLLQLDVENLMGNIDLQPERITEIPSSRAALRKKGKIRTRDKNRSGSKIFKWIGILIVLGAVGAVGLTQLPKFGINSLSELISLPGGNSDTTEPNQIEIPDSSSQGASQIQGQQQGALIRIE